MTTLVTVIARDAIVMGTDSLCTYLLADGSQIQGQGDKIWPINNRQFGVSSYGQGTNVPAIVSMIKSAANDPLQIGCDLLVALNQTSPMFLHVGGYATGSPQLALVDVANASVTHLNSLKPHGWWHLGFLPLDYGAKELPKGAQFGRMEVATAVSRVESVIRRAANDHPRDVGLPVRIVVLRPS
jgi:hypothetical protein